MNQSSLERVGVVATGAQSAETRFGKRRRGDDLLQAPPISIWRCNLLTAYCQTGLSQVHNLYFVASGESIYCYIPRFPSQELSPQPVLIVNSLPSGPNLPGHIDARCPHAINNLVVQLLGTEEVVAAVRDDGDVDAFLVRHIVQAIEKRAETRGGKLTVEADEVRPIFQSNVGNSAWGLAIHSNARIIATSANTHNITIFMLGLIGQDDDGHQTDAEQQLLSRKTDVTQRVINGDCNIPHIAFCNTGDDPHARWLLTTDISGFCRTIDLHQRRHAQSFRFDTPVNYLMYAGHDQRNAGWGIMFLDRRSFVPERSIEAALGIETEEALPGLEALPNLDALPGLRIDSALWNISSAVTFVQDRSMFFMYQAQPVRRDVRSPASTEPRNDANAATNERTTDTPPINQNLSRVDSAASHDSQETTTTEDWDSDSSLSPSEADFTHRNASPRLATGPIRSLRTPVSNNNENSSHNRLMHTTTENLCGDMPCPMLHVSVTSVYLLQPSSKRRPDAESPFASPTITLNNVLAQRIRDEFSFLDLFERLNMHAYIPPLGVVVLASQKGRAMVLALTRHTQPGAAARRSSSSSNTTSANAKTSNGSTPGCVYGMRLDAVLPFASQEAVGARPFQPLAGIAVGPMQGSERLPAARKRWRLMLMYADHAVLSYEIRRRRACDAAVDVAGLVM